MKSNNHEEALYRLKEQAKSTGLKLTKQRETIAMVFFAQVGHKSAEEILTYTRQVDEGISLATVYRTLKILQEYGFAEAHHFQDGQALFEPNLDLDKHHDHLICTKCHKIIEFFNEDIERLQDRVASAQDFLVTHHKMELYGLCGSCR